MTHEEVLRQVRIGIAKAYEDYYDEAHARWLAEPSKANAETLDRARAAMQRARRIEAEARP